MNIVSSFSKGPFLKSEVMDHPDINHLFDQKVRTTTATFFVNLSTTIIGFINTIFINRWLGPFAVGEYLLVTSSALVLVQILSFGVELGNATLVAQDSSRTGRILCNSIFWAGGIGIVVLAVFYFLHPLLLPILFKNIPVTSVFLGLLSVPIILCSNYVLAIALGMNNFRILNRTNLLSALFMLLINSTLLVVFQLGVQSILTADICRNIFILAASIFWIWRSRSLTLEKVDFHLLKEVFELGGKSHIGNLANYILSRADFFLVNNLLGTQSVGLYAIARLMGEKLWLLIQPTYNVAFPQIIASKAEDGKILTARLTRHSFVVLAIFSLLTLWLGKSAIQFFYGVLFEKSSLYLNLLLPYVIFMAASWYPSLFVIGKLRKPLITSLVAWTTLILFVPLSWLFIHFFQVAGAAIAMSLAAVFYFFLHWTIFVKLSQSSFVTTLRIKKEDWQLLISALQSASRSIVSKIKKPSFFS